LLGETTLVYRISKGAAEGRRLLQVTYRQHLVSLIKNEHLHGVGLQEAPLDHVLDTTRSANNNLGTILKGLHVIANTGSTNAGVALDLHEVANGDDDLLDLLSQLASGGKNESLALLDVRVDLLQDRDGESSGLAGTRLGLGNNIVAYADVSGYWSPSREVEIVCIPLMTGMMARCWIAEGRSKP